MLKRFTDEELKENGFEKVDSMKCYKNGGVVASYGLIVSIGNKTAKGYHDYDVTTAGHVTRATGVDTATRRKKWDIMEKDEWEKFANEWIETNMRNV